MNSTQDEYSQEHDLPPSQWPAGELCGLPGVTGYHMRSKSFILTSNPTHWKEALPWAQCTENTRASIALVQLIHMWRYFTWKGKLRETEAIANSLFWLPISKSRSIREKYNTVPVTRSETMSQRTCLRGKTGCKTESLMLFPKELILFATECEEV